MSEYTGEEIANFFVLSKNLLPFSDCKKPVKKKMAWDSFTSIKDFGYKFNEGIIIINDAPHLGISYEKYPTIYCAVSCWN